MIGKLLSESSACKRQERTHPVTIGIHPHHHCMAVTNIRRRLLA